VNPHNSDTTYRFEWGETSAYGQSSPSVDADDDNQPHAVALPLDSLTPGTTYHYRVVASSDAGDTAGDDRSFTTATPPPTPSATPPTGQQPPTTDPGPDATAPTPDIGNTVVASPATGTVRVRAPGADHYTTLGANDVVPVGARVDTRRGAIDVVTDLGDGHTQKAKFWNGVFTIKQSKKGKGYTDIYVAPATGCTAPAKAKKSGGVSAARKKKHRRNSLWGSDNHGRFRGHGRGSIATVRGTTWLMEERCEGSYTKVKQGKVSVRDRRRHVTVLVRAGHSYLARTRP
jgi:hypothetical protein